MFEVTTRNQPFVRKPLDYHFHFPRTFFIPVNYALFTHNTRTIDAQYTHYSYDLDAFYSYHRYCLIIYKTNESVVRHSRCLILISSLSLLTNRAHGLPIAAIKCVPVHTIGIEVHAARVVRTARAERTRPVPAFAACEVEVAIETNTRGGEENTIAVRTCHNVTIHTVLSSPCPSTLCA